jgi:hypothetical protein
MGQLWCLSDLRVAWSQVWPQGLRVLNSKTYGETKIWYLTYEEAQ